MKTLSRIVAVALFLVSSQSGCSSDNATNSVSVAPKVVQSPSGFWSAKDVTIGTRIHGIDCMVAETQQLTCRTYIDGFDFFSAITGTLQVNGPRVSGSGSYFAAPGRSLPDGSTISELTIVSGTISEFNSLSLTIDVAGVRFTALFEYNSDLHDRGSALKTVEGVYPIFGFLEDSASFSVDATGVISSQSGSGCVCNGQISIIDDRYNIYDVALEVANCGAFDGVYAGLGLTTYIVVRDNAEVQNPTSNDVFLFNVFTEQLVIDGIASK